LLESPCRSLRLSVECADRFKCIAEEIEPDGVGMTGRKQIENTTAHGVFARIHDVSGAGITGPFQAPDNIVHTDHGAGF